MNYWYSPRVKGGKKAPHFQCPQGPEQAGGGEQCIDRFASLWDAGRARAPHPRRRRRRRRGRRGSAAARDSRPSSTSFMEPQIKTPWLEEGGLLPRAPHLQPWRRGGAPDLGAAGRRGRAGLAGARSSTDDLPLPARPSERRPSRVSGLGPHERQLRRGRGPREERRGFKGPHPTNPCHPAGPPRRAWPWGWLPAPRRPPNPSLARPRAPGKVGAAPPPSPAATTAPAQLREPLDPVRTLQTVSWRIRTTSAERDAGIKIGPTRRQIIKDGSKKKEERRKPAGEGRPSPLGRLPGGRAFCSSVPPPPAGPRPRPGEHVAICQALGRVSI